MPRAATSVAAPHGPAVARTITLKYSHVLPSTGNFQLAADVHAIGNKCLKH